MSSENLSPENKTGAFPATLARLEQEVDEGVFTRGAQICIVHAGATVLSLALGDAGTGPMTTTSVFKVYCTIKPVTAVAVAKLVGSGLLDLDQPVADALPDVSCVASGVITFRHLLTHTAGLHLPGAVEAEQRSADKRRAWLASTPYPSRGFRIGRDAAYSEYPAWTLLGWTIEAVTGRPLREYLRAEVLDPLGMSNTWIGMTPQEYDANIGRIGLNYEFRGSLEGMPLLLERVRRVCLECNPAFGGYTTAEDLARFYSSLVAQLRDGDNPDLPDREILAAFCSTARERAFDHVLGRECEFGLGFMTALGDHHFGTGCSPGSFGHSGNVGASFGFADPQYELAVGVIFNGIVDAESSFLRRPRLVRAIYQDLGLGGERT